MVMKREILKVKLWKSGMALSAIPVLKVVLFLDRLQIIEIFNRSLIRAIQRRNVGSVAVLCESCPNAFISGLEGRRTIHQWDGGQLAEPNLIDFGVDLDLFVFIFWNSCLIKKFIDAIIMIAVEVSIGGLAEFRNTFAVQWRPCPAPSGCLLRW